MATRYVKSGGVFVDLGGGGATVNPVPNGEFTVTGTTGFFTNSMWCNPLRITASTTVDRIGIIVVSSVGNIDVGIYADSAGQPGTRLVSTGSMACPAAGVQEVAITETVLSAGLYWLAIALSSASTTLRYAEATVGHLDTVTDTVVASRAKTSSAFPLADPGSGTSASSSAVTMWVNHS